MPSRGGVRGSCDGEPLHLPLQTFDINDQVHLDNFRKDNQELIGDLENSSFRWALKDPTSRRRGGTGIKKMASIIIDFVDMEKADAAIEMKLRWEVKDKEVVKSFRGRPQCRKCQSYGHLAHKCTAGPRCGYCSENHESRNCKGKNNGNTNEEGESTHLKCALCTGTHSSLVDRHLCPAKEEEYNRTYKEFLKRGSYYQNQLSVGLHA